VASERLVARKTPERPAEGAGPTGSRQDCGPGPL